MDVNFTSIYNALDDIYELYSDDDQIVGGVVSIYAKMCVNNALVKQLLDHGEGYFLS